MGTDFTQDWESARRLAMSVEEVIAKLEPTTVTVPAPSSSKTEAKPSLRRLDAFVMDDASSTTEMKG